MNAAVRGIEASFPLPAQALAVSYSWPGPGLGNKAFTGREWDPEVGLYYYRARYYSPSAGRFASEDPIGFRGGNNFYSYVDGDPVNYVDPTGLILWKCTRKSEGFLGIFFDANHVYFCDPGTGKSCGKGKNGGKSRPREDEQCPGANCVPIPDSAGKEEDLLNCCRFEIRDEPGNNGFFPGTDDCHTYLNRCLTRYNLKDPATPGGRMGCISGCPRDPYSPSPSKPGGHK